MKKIKYILLLIIVLLFSQPMDLLGDVNADGAVDVLDIVIVVDIILTDGVNYDDYQLWASDVNLDQSTDVADVVTMVQVILFNGNCPELYSPCSDNLSSCCLDSTSHSFSWSIDTLGIYGSYLKDVAIVNENDIWVVGNIRMPDPDSTNGTGYQNFNAAHWDGSEWELIQIYGPFDLYSIAYFSENDIWVTSHCFPFHWDGNEWTLYHLQNMGLDACAGNAIWGTSSSDMYFVGVNGGIVHYDGVNFVQMESGTDVDLKDIAGTPDGEHVFVRGYDGNVPSENIILEFGGNQWNTIYHIEGHYFPEPGDYGHIEGIGVYGDTLYVSTVAGLWKYNYIDENSLLIPDNITHFNQGAFIDIHIQAEYDIYFSGAGFTYIHYNGSTYYYNQDIYEMYPQRANRGSDYNRNLVVVVGFFNWYEGALVAKGYHE